MYIPDIATGVAAATIADHIQKDPSKRPIEDILEEIKDLLDRQLKYFSETRANKDDKHITDLIYASKPRSIVYNGYLGIYVLVSATSTFTVTVSGLGSFVWTPNVGTYNRWKFPEGTTIQLLTPAQVNFPIDIMYTDDLTNN